MEKIYLVTGAAGFLGGTVCRQLIERGDKVRAFVLPGDKAMAYVPKEAEIVEGDLCDMESLERFFSVPEDSEIIVMHIASIVTVNPDYNPKVMAVNVGGTDNVISLCKKYGVKRLVYVGSTGAVPELSKPQPMSEVDHYDPKQVVGCYSQSKAIASQHVLDAAKEGLDALITLPTGIMGPEDYSISETTKTVIDILKGKMPMGIDGSFNLVDVRDLAAGVIAAADKGRKGESYILGNDVVTFKEFAKILHDEGGCKRIKLFLPLWLANGMAKLAEMHAKRKGTKPLLTTFSIYNLAKNNAFDCSKARKELGYVTRPYAQTIREECHWLREHANI